MTPKLLTFEAFGPYVERQTIDFSTLSTNGLFLIHGQTGSGKTVILDAITYALYGKSSGGSRGDITTMRCQMAPENISLMVEFEFVQRGKLYKFSRTMRMRNKRNGSVEFVPEQNAFLKDENGDFVPFFENPKLRNIEQKAEEIIGLTYDQFRQVIILPQGQFENFLVAKSDEKENILVTLFNAEKWKVMADWLCDKAKKMSDEIETEEIGIRSLLLSQGCVNIEELQIKLDEVSGHLVESQKNKEIVFNEFVEAQQTFQALSLLSSQFVEKEKGEVEFKKILEREPEVLAISDKLAIAKNAEQVRPTWNALKDLRMGHVTRCKIENEIKITYEASIQGFNKLDIEYKELNQKKSDIEDKKKRITQLEGKMENYLKAESIKKASIDAEKAFVEISIETEKCEKQVVSFEAIKSQLLAEREHIITNHTTKLPEQKEKFDGLKKVENIKEKVALLEQSLSGLSSEIITLNTEEEELSDSLNNLEHEYEHLNTIYLGNAAVAMASRLKESDPCPVCGSTTHPQMAQMTSQEADISSIKKLFSTIEKERKSVAKAEQNLAKSIITKEAKQKDYDELQNELKGHEEFTNELLMEAQIAYEKSVIENNKVANLNIKIADAEENFNSEKAEYELHKSKKQEAMNANEKAMAEAQALMGQLDPDIADFNVLNEMMTKMQNETSKFESNLKTVEDGFHKAKEQLTISGTSLANAKMEVDKAKEAVDKSMLDFTKILKEKNFIDEMSFECSIMEPEMIALLDKKVADFRTEKDAARINIDKLELSLKDKERPDVEKENAVLNECESRKTKIDQEFTLLNKVQIDMSDLLASMGKKHEVLSVKKEKHGRLKVFGLMLRGDNGISLRRYVLGVMLSSITNEANKLLRKVHDERYQLFRSMEGTGRSRKAGLDLEVFDSYSGEKRPVSSLSGGEKFLVALSLSLGLSAVVQAQSGGIRIDAMFIDEGFGSLDPNSIQNALDILTSVRGSTRLVGIISHVQTLKDNIEATIEVRKDRNGSKLVVNA